MTEAQCPEVEDAVDIIRNVGQPGGLFQPRISRTVMMSTQNSWRQPEGNNLDLAPAGVDAALPAENGGCGNCEVHCKVTPCSCSSLFGKRVLSKVRGANRSIDIQNESNAAIAENGRGCDAVD